MYEMIANTPNYNNHPHFVSFLLYHLSYSLYQEVSLLSLLIKSRADRQANHAKQIVFVLSSTAIGLRADSKNNTDYIGMSISEDLTIAERAVLKEWVDKAKPRNQGLPTNSNSIWRVRGDSKNGYRLRSSQYPNNQYKY